MSDLVLGRTQDLYLSLSAMCPTATKSQCLRVAKVLPPSVPCRLWPVLLKHPQSTLPSSWTVCKWPSFSARRPALGSSPAAVLFLRSCATVLMATEKNNFSSLVLRGILKERSLVSPYSCTTYFFLICLPSPAFISSVTNTDLPPCLDQSHLARPSSFAAPNFLLSLPLTPWDAFAFSVCQGTLWSCGFLVFPCRFPSSKISFSMVSNDFQLSQRDISSTLKSLGHSAAVEAAKLLLLWRNNLSSELFFWSEICPSLKLSTWGTLVGLAVSSSPTTLSAFAQQVPVSHSS